MSVEKLFQPTDVIVSEVGSKLAWGTAQYTNEDIVNSIKNILEAKRTDFGGEVEYDVSSTTYPDKKATVDDIINNTENYVDCIRAQLKELYIQVYNKAQESKH